MLKNYLFIALSVFCFTTKYLAQLYSPIATWGYNTDAVAESGTASLTTSAMIDGSDHVMYSFAYGQNFTNPFVTGLPNNGLVSTSTRTYQMQPYNQNNLLYVPSLGTDSLMLVTPAAYTTISLLAFSTEGFGSMNVKMRFTDGTTQLFSTISMPDWYTPVPNAMIAFFDRATRTTGIPDFNGSNNMYSVDLNPTCANSTKSIQSISIQNPTTMQRMCIVAISAGISSYSISAPSGTVCQGGSFVASVVSSSLQSFNYAWAGPSGSSFSSPSGQNTTIIPGPISTASATEIYTVQVTPVISNCPATTTFSIGIILPPPPVLTMPPTPLCNTSTLSSVTANPSGGTWFGNPIVSSNGIVSPSQATTFGLLPVSYSVMIGACSASNTAIISISQYNTPSFTGTISSVCSNDPPVDLMSVVSNSLGIWTGAGVSTNSFFPGPLPTGNYTLTYFNGSSPFSAACPAFNKLIIAVFNPPTPAIKAITPKCTNSPTVTLTATPSGGTWSGNSGVTPSGVQKPALSTNTLGLNSVFYTAGQGTCVASSSGSFQVSGFNSAALNTSFLQLCVSGNAVDLMSVVSNTGSGVWKGSSGISGTYSFNPSGLVTNTYLVSYHTNSFPNLGLCPDSSSLIISVLNPIQPSIAAVGPKCSVDAPFQLSVSPGTGSFVTSLYLSAGGIFTPSLAFLGNNPVQYIVGTSTCNATDTKSVNVEAFVPATISNTLADQCSSSPLVDLLPLTVNNLGNWSGSGINGSSFDPSSSGVGSVLLTYSTSSQPSGLCPDYQTLVVNVYSLSTPAIAPMGPYCNSYPPVKLQVSPLGGVFSSTGTSALDPQGLFNPAFGIIGDNLVNYSITAGPCVAYTQTIIRIEKFIPADFSDYAGPFCRNDPSINLASLVQNPGGSWSGPGITGAVFSPADAQIGNTNVITYYTHSSPDQDLCPDSKTIRIQVNPSPTVSVSDPIKKGCSPVEVKFETPGLITGRGQWTWGDGVETQEALSASHTYSVPGTYTVVFNYWDAIGCSTQTVLTNAVTVYDMPQAVFSYQKPYNEISLAEPEVQFLNQSKELANNTYEWQIGNLYTTSEVSPKVIFNAAGDYHITLTATTIHGCKNETEQVLIVKPQFSIYIPNSFSPNSDGLNDVFHPLFSPYGVDKTVFELEIFDRWGASIYHSQDITGGWNGSFHNNGDEVLKQDIYVYKMEYKDLDGRTYSSNGYVTLLK